jgi:hypothetical protein
MTTATDTPPGAPSDADVDAALRALQARLLESKPEAFYCRPLQRRQIATLMHIVIRYRALTQRQEE